MQQVIQVILRGGGNIVYYYTNDTHLKPGDYVIVEVERGQDYDAYRLYNNTQYSRHLSISPG